MGRLADLGIAKRLSLIVVVGAVTLGTIAGVGMYTQNAMADQAELAVSLLRGKSALNHLDTRESELKVDAHRAAAGEDVTQDVTDDVASVGEAFTALDDAGMPAGLDAQVGQIHDEVEGFTTFIIEFAKAAADDPESAAKQTSQIGEKNNVVDDALSALHEQIDAAVSREEADMQSTITRGRVVSIAVALLGLVLLILLSIPLVRSILRPVNAVGTVIDALASGDLTRRTGVGSRDELGQMAASLDRTLDGLHETVTTMGGNADMLAHASNELVTVAAQIANASRSVTAQTGEANSAANEISFNVQTVAAGSEEMGAAIAEISNNAGAAAQTASTAVNEARTAGDVIRKLGVSSEEIGNVVKLITSIAEQTNLLALNATIEAARAGEMGKGFAVVASEVKDLAQETAKATEDISARVAAIQADATNAVDVMDRISVVIEQINDYQTTIASAVEEQTATTAEMSRSIVEVSTSSSVIAGSISDVATASASTLNGVNQAHAAAGEVKRAASALHAIVERFTV
ncbi:methyl-accepting chemotaxis protein [Actinoplanes couchii]|uniref:Methyl-accepting chemotaxis sensory transducer n=1 Tax=Actinoplanes couchii TaxID=403638 RepID=A0ABQ3XTM1_9ACTN|nr:methyl-accepting chemotaxis protein [Actinoplanes couchii]MDR6324131.1 methyl-accepting chemotaxis protein [Actinoplanes couchii]GID61866.1 hypothetical protein Aco03nite_102700 [Actinoplanes couchii]